MRIVEVTQRFPPALGGVEIHVSTIARELRARGHQVEVITTDLARDRPFSRLGSSSQTAGYPARRHRAFRTIPSPHGLGIVAPGMAFDLLSTRADIVHAHAFGMAPTWISAAIRRLRKTPLAIETHMDVGRGTAGWRVYARSVARLTLRPADRVVVQTELESRLVASLGVRPDRIAQISDGIDLAEFSGTEARSPARQRLTVLFVGRLYARHKGLDPLVRAFALVPRDLELRLRIVGEDWGGRSVVDHLASELDVQDRVSLTGPVSRAELLEEYRRADLFVLPSLFEPYGIVLMEAMASGLPIVATRVGGIPEVVAEGENALLVPAGDPRGLAEALETLARDRTLRTNFADSGRARVQRFSWNEVIPQWIRLFETMIEHRS